MSSIPAVADATFVQHVEQSPGLVAVDFTAEWCGPCRLMGPVLDALAAEYGARVRIVKLDTDANPATTARFGVRSLPTILFFRDGKVVDQVVGAVPAARLRTRIDDLLAA